MFIKLYACLMIAVLALGLSACQQQIPTSGEVMMSLPIVTEAQDGDKYGSSTTNVAQKSTSTRVSPSIVDRDERQPQ